MKPKKKPIKKKPKKKPVKKPAFITDEFTTGSAANDTKNGNY